MTSTQSLTEREQQALEHMRKAQELGTTLKEYAARFGLDVQQLYQPRKPLVRKGALGVGTAARASGRPVEGVPALNVSSASKIAS